MKERKSSPSEFGVKGDGNETVSSSVAGWGSIGKLGFSSVACLSAGLTGSKCLGALLNVKPGVLRLLGWVAKVERR